MLDVTVLNLRPLLNYDAEKTFFGGYKSSTDLDATLTLGRAVDTGTGPDWPPFPFDSTLEPAALGGRASRVMLTATIGLSRVGAFYVDAEKAGISHRMITITMARSSKYLVFLRLKHWLSFGHEDTTFSKVSLLCVTKILMHKFTISDFFHTLPLTAEKKHVYILFNHGKYL